MDDIEFCDNMRASEMRLGAVLEQGGWTPNDESFMLFFRWVALGVPIAPGCRDVQAQRSTAL